MLPVPVAARHEFYHLDLAVDPLGRGVRDPVLEVGQEVGQVSLERLGSRDDRRHPRVRRPEVPRVEILLGALGVRVRPEIPQCLFDRPGAAGLGLRVLYGHEFPATPLPNVLLATKPPALRAPWTLVAT